MSNWKTEAEVRAEKAKNAAPPKMDAARKQELEATLQRLGSVAAVFQMRADALPVSTFGRIREFMDIYIAGGLRAISEGQDFVHQGIKLSDEESRDIHRLMRDVFNLDISVPDGPPPKK
jgi:hypothetical protein